MHRDEVHLRQRVGWLRAAVLGAHRGPVSPPHLIFGVAATDAGSARTAGLVAGAMPMAAEEYAFI